MLDNINKAYVNKENRPLQNIRLKHTIVIDDPFENREAEFGVRLRYPERSPSPLKLKEDVDLQNIDF